MKIWLTTLAAFALAGVVGALVWWQVVDLPAYTRVGTNGSMDAVELSRSVAIDGWYAVIGGGLALVLGAVLCRFVGADHPRMTVVALLLAGLVGGSLMLHLGEALGPGPIEPRLEAAAEGDRVLVPLVASTPQLFWVWPIAALAGAVLVLLGGRDRDPAEPDDYPAAQAAS